MPTIEVQLKRVTVRRDAFSIIPTTVPAYELAILRMQFGKENVQELGDGGTATIDPENESERLANKYGEHKVLKVFGDDGGERLTEVVMRAEAKSKPAKTEAAEQDAAPEAKRAGRPPKAAPAAQDAAE